jgi:hypothetical protein
VGTGPTSTEDNLILGTPEKPFNFFQLSLFARRLAVRRCRQGHIYQVTPADMGQSVSALLLVQYRDTGTPLDQPLTDCHGNLYGIGFVRRNINRLTKYAEKHRRELNITDLVDDDTLGNPMDEFEWKPKPTSSPEQIEFAARVKAQIKELLTEAELDILERLHCGDYTPEMVAVVYSTSEDEIKEIDERVKKSLRDKLGRHFPDYGVPKTEAARLCYEDKLKRERERRAESVTAV